MICILPIMSTSDSASPPSSMGTTPDSSTPVRTRRSKGKSRFGCAKCKASRVKCDEIHPTCTRCKTTSQECVYATAHVPKWKSAAGTLVLPTHKAPPSTRRKTPHPSLADSCSTLDFIQKLREPATIPSQISFLPLEYAKSFDGRDVFLLNHFRSSTSGGLWGSQQVWAEDGIRLAFDHTFLMHAMIALAARHLQTLPTPSSGTYVPKPELSQLEERHYQRALGTYSTALRAGIQRNNQAVLAASFILVYYSCSLLNYSPGSATPSDDASITFIRGIRTIVHSLKFMSGGPMNNLIHAVDGLPSREPDDEPGMQLLTLIDSLPLTSHSLEHKEIYRERIHSLTPYFEHCTWQHFAAPSTQELVIRFLRWQALCPPEYVQLIRSYDKAALAILAHYYAAAAIHLARLSNGWWWWKDKPAYMVQTILDYLDDEWDEWKEWPRMMLLRSKGISME